MGPGSPQKRSFFDRLWDALGYDAPTGGSSASAPAMERQQAAEERVAAMMVSAESAAASALGNLQILNLSDMEARVGPAWPRVSKMVHMLIENTLSKRLHHRDTFFRCKEGVYAVVFAETTKAEAEERCEIIVAEIRQRLFGDPEGARDPDVSAVRVHAEAMDQNLAAVAGAANKLEAVGQLVIDAASQPRSPLPSADNLDHLLSTVRATLDELLSRQSGGVDAVAIGRVDGLLDQLRAIEREAARKLSSEPRPSARSKSVQLKPISRKIDAERENAVWQQIGTRGSGQLAQLSEFLATTESRLAGLREQIVKSPDGAADDADLIEWKRIPDQKLAYHVDYLQGFDTERSLATINLARIHFKQGDQPVSLNDLISDENEEETRAIASRLLMREVISELEQHADNRPIVCVTIDDVILSHLGSRRSFVSLVSQIPVELRRMILFEIKLHAGWQLDVPSLAVRELRPYCGGLFLRFPVAEVMAGVNLHRVNSAILREMRAIGTSAPQPESVEPAFIRALGTFAASCEGLSLPCYLGEIPRKSMMINALGAGVRYVSGAKIRPPVSHSKIVEACLIEDFYKRPQVAGAQR